MCCEWELMRNTSLWHMCKVIHIPDSQAFHMSAIKKDLFVKTHLTESNAPPESWVVSALSRWVMTSLFHFTSWIYLEFLSLSERRQSFASPQTETWTMTIQLSSSLFVVPLSNRTDSWFNGWNQKVFEVHRVAVISHSPLLFRNHHVQTRDLTTTVMVMCIHLYMFLYHSRPVVQMRPTATFFIFIFINFFVAWESFKDVLI